jgi:hypothetical protein
MLDTALADVAPVSALAHTNNNKSHYKINSFLQILTYRIKTFTL